MTDRAAEKTPAGDVQEGPAERGPAEEGPVQEGPAQEGPVQEEGVGDGELEAVQAACRVLVAISSQSIAAVEDQVDLTQFRALVIVASRGSLSLGELAEAGALHLSTASRMCERMVAAGLMNRADDPTNRRQLILTLTAEGRRLVDEVMRSRRAAFEPMLAAMPKSRRAELVMLLQEFAATAPPPPESDLWSMGWQT